MQIGIEPLPDTGYEVFRDFVAMRAVALRNAIRKG